MTISAQTLMRRNERDLCAVAQRKLRHVLTSWEAVSSANTL